MSYLLHQQSGGCCWWEEKIKMKEKPALSNVLCKPVSFSRLSVWIVSNMLKHHPFAGIVFLVVSKCIFTEFNSSCTRFLFFFSLLHFFPRIKQWNPVLEGFCSVTFLLFKLNSLGERKNYWEKYIYDSFQKAVKMPPLH